MGCKTIENSTCVGLLSVASVLALSVRPLKISTDADAMHPALE